MQPWERQLNDYKEQLKARDTEVRNLKATLKETLDAIREIREFLHHSRTKHADAVIQRLEGVELH